MSDECLCQPITVTPIGELLRLTMAIEMCEESAPDVRELLMDVASHFSKYILSQWEIKPTFGVIQGGKQ